MSNVRLLHLVSLLSGLRFGLGIWVLFYLRITDYAGIGLAETVTIVTAFALEVPTGIAADRFGRKPCLIGAFVLELAGYLLLAAASDLTGLLVSLGILQLGKSLQSGTFEALLWESLDEADRERDYVRVYGRINATQLFAVAAASLLGGFLYQVDQRLPFAAAGAAFGVAAIAALWLREPARAAHEPSAHAATHVTADLRTATAALARAWRLTVPLLLVGAFLAVSEEVLDDVLSVEFGFSPTGLGALVALAYVGAAAAAHASHRLEHGVGTAPAGVRPRPRRRRHAGAVAEVGTARGRTRRPAPPRVPRGARDRRHRSARGGGSAVAASHRPLDVSGGPPAALRRLRLERRHLDGSHHRARLRSVVRRGHGGRNAGRLVALDRSPTGRRGHHRAASAGAERW